MEGRRESNNFYEEKCTNDLTERGRTQMPAFLIEFPFYIYLDCPPGFPNSPFPL